MIPIKLSLRNFMCYAGDVPPLEFNGIHTACICGGNGNGKSALIDAVTWALWGKTRAKSDDSLIHQGSAEVGVEFDFGAGGHTYRIVRKHSGPKKAGRSGQSSLDLLIKDDEGFKTISADTIASTQQRIIDLLHMDYATFINSAFLRQGHADEFTTANPSKRKEVLGSILELDVYEALEARAKEMAGGQAAEEAALAASLKEMDEELAQKESRQEELKSAEEGLARADKEAEGSERELTRLKGEADELRHKAQRVKELKERTAKAERDMARWEELNKHHHIRIAEYEGLITKKDDITQGYARFAEAKGLAADMDAKLRLTSRLGERKHELEMHLTQAAGALKNEHAATMTRISQLDRQVGHLAELKTERKKSQANLEQLTGGQKQLNQAREGLNQARYQVNRLEASIAQVKSRIEETGEKVEMLKTGGGDKCPLCESELKEDGLELIRSKYEEELGLYRQALTDARAEKQQAEKEAARLEEDLRLKEAEQVELTDAAKVKIAAFNKDIADAEAARATLEEEKKALADIEERLAKGDYAPGEAEALGRVEAELNGIEYDPTAHDAARKSLQQFERYDELHRNLADAERLIGEERTGAKRAGEAARELSEALATERHEQEVLAAKLTALEGIKENLARAEEEYQRAAERQRAGREAVAQAKARLAQIKEVEARRKEKGKLMTQAAELEGVYRDLAAAFGKKGIQALIIERALPEIEDEANRLLGRMTDNRMHLKMETQKLTKKGDVAETLDINISDELGTRNYEMFSGGEAFRINFAVRIALSRLLARRAGAPLPTLIIDEGFGTQDAAGIEKLKEAINSIQDDFVKILVITHIEELKDAFPTRINVEKTAQGSTLYIS